MLVGIDAAMVLLQLQAVATGCSVGVNDIRLTSTLVMAAMQHGNFTVGTTLKGGLPLGHIPEIKHYYY